VQPQHIDQVSGTRALLIAVAAVNDNVAWASGDKGTYVRTTDGGTTWHAAQVPGADSIQFRDVYATDANNAWLLSIGNGPQSRIYHTSDGGAHWTLQFRNQDPKAFYDCLDFWDARRGFAVGDAIGDQLAILTTSDGGDHWTRIDPTRLPKAMSEEGSFAASGTCALARPGGHAWIVASNPEVGRILHSRDYGQTWSVDTLPITTRAGTGPESVMFVDASHGMVLGGGQTSKPGDSFTAVTSDGGRTWSRRNSMPLLRGAWGGAYVTGATPATVVAVSPSGAAFTRDNGNTWTQIDANNYWAVAFASPRAGWAVGNGGRITKLVF
jgi:photosystem II stability/assembly factor-like uncharacterized protein